MNYKKYIGLLILLGFTKLGVAQEVHPFYKYVPSATESKGWLVILPGSSGLKLFGDTTHYYSYAYEFRNSGYDVLMLDYKGAYQHAKRTVEESTGEKILWVLNDAIKWAKEKDLIMGTGGVVGWSLAGEGLILLSNEPSQVDDIKFICLLYPSNKGEVFSKSKTPLLVLTGLEDNVTPFSMVSKTFQHCEYCEVVGYENAAHGFDVKSLSKARSIRFPPILGRKYTFEYNEKAAQNAKSRLIDFIARNVQSSKQ